MCQLKIEASGVINGEVAPIGEANRHTFIPTVVISLTDRSLFAGGFWTTRNLAPRCRKGGHPPHHSITSSARARREGGMVRPRALAVFRWIISSSFEDSITGRSDGFSPLRILAA